VSLGATGRCTDSNNTQRINNIQLLTPMLCYKQCTSQRRLYTVANVIARATLKCGCYLATLYHLRWLYGAEWERTVMKRVRL